LCQVLGKMFPHKPRLICSCSPLVRRKFTKAELDLHLHRIIVVCSQWSFRKESLFKDKSEYVPARSAKENPASAALWIRNCLWDSATNGSRIASAKYTAKGQTSVGS